MPDRPVLRESKEIRDLKVSQGPKGIRANQDPKATPVQKALKGRLDLKAL